MIKKNTEISKPYAVPAKNLFLEKVQAEPTTSGNTLNNVPTLNPRPSNHCSRQPTEI
jgi:hypothetical protein